MADNTDSVNLELIIPEHMKPKDGRFGSGPTKVPVERLAGLAKFLSGTDDQATACNQPSVKSVNK